MQNIRVATYNVHKCIGMDRKLLPGRIAEVIAEFHPDVIGLQEVLSLDTLRREDHQAQYLAEALGMHVALGEVRQLYGGAYGNVVLSRFPVHNFCTFDLSAPGQERRGCVRTDVILPPGDVLHLFNFHLGTGFMERRWQARRILETELIRSRDLQGPRVVVGDFNEWTRGLVSAMFAAELRGADIRMHLKWRRTYPGFLPFLHLDHIYYDHDLVLDHVFLHKSRKALVASDHLPLVADFAVKPQPVRNEHAAGDAHHGR
jgi:endonuclease/exonuclease/phosphatase family metal-dependent hydrolase